MIQLKHGATRTISRCVSKIFVNILSLIQSENVNVIKNLQIKHERYNNEIVRFILDELKSFISKNIG